MHGRVNLQTYSQFSEGGFFTARMTFPQEYPLMPPKLKFISEMWHPNGNFSIFISLILLGRRLPSLWRSVYADGEVCISILVRFIRWYCSLRSAHFWFIWMISFNRSIHQVKINTVTNKPANAGFQCTPSRQSYLVLYHCCRALMMNHLQTWKLRKSGEMTIPCLRKKYSRLLGNLLNCEQC